MCTTPKRHGIQPPPMANEAERNYLLETLWPDIRRLARKYRSSRPQDADDLAQEIAMTVLLRSGSYEKMKSKVTPYSWLFKLAMGTNRSVYLKRQRRLALCAMIDIEESPNLAEWNDSEPH